jgi:hypothetical protein
LKKSQEQKSGEISPQFPDRHENAVFSIRSDLPGTRTKPENLVRNNNAKDFVRKFMPVISSSEFHSSAWCGRDSEDFERSTKEVHNNIHRMQNQNPHELSENRESII